MATFNNQQNGSQNQNQTTSQSSQQSGSSTTQASGSMGQTNSGANQNMYTAGQQALQSLMPDVLTSMISAGPQYNNEAAYQSFANQFNNRAAPAIAAQFGPGSPQMGAQYTQGLTDLTAQLFNQGNQNYLQTLGLGGNIGFGNAIGQQSSSNQNQDTNSTTNNTNQQNNSLIGSLISQLATAGSSIGGF